MRPLWLPNIKKFTTGRTVGSAQCIQVSVENTVPIPITPANYTYKERRFHLPATTNINGRAGAWIQLDANSDNAGSTPADIANTISEMRISLNGSDALEIGKGANSGAVTVIAAIAAGQTTAIGVTLVAGDKVWVRCIKSTASTGGELLVSFLG